MSEYILLNPQTFLLLFDIVRRDIEPQLKIESSILIFKIFLSSTLETFSIYIYHYILCCLFVCKRLTTTWLNPGKVYGCSELQKIH